jgi:RNA polymerase sigma-70 factor (ECF subfamily)
MHSGLFERWLLAIGKKEQITMSGETFAALLAPHLRAVRRFVGAQLRMVDQTDDVLQQTLLHAFAKRDQLRIHSKFKSWLWSIAMNEVRGFHRRTRTFVPLDLLPEFPSIDRSSCPHASYERGESIERMNTALSKLSDRDRNSIHLVDFGGLKVAEAAKVTAVSTAALKSTHHRAQQRLACALGVRRGQSRTANSAGPVSQTAQARRFA